MQRDTGWQKKKRRPKKKKVRVQKNRYSKGGAPISQGLSSCFNCLIGPFRLCVGTLLRVGRTTHLVFPC